MLNAKSSGSFRIVVAGGGAGGLELITRLGKRLGRRPGVTLTLIDQNPAHLWKPLLHEVAAGTLNSNEDELGYLAHAHWHHFQFHLGRLAALDRTRKVLAIAATVDDDGQEYLPRRELPYDCLVVAIGSVTNDFQIQGVAEHCWFLDSRAQADSFHLRLLHACYAANAQAAPLREGQLHVAIAGAGATGVELAAELHHAVRALIRYGLDRINPERDIRIHLIDASARILPGLSPEIARAAQRALESLSITVHTGEVITAATATGLHTKSGKTIPAEIKVWAAGIKGSDVLAKLDGLEVNRAGQLVVRATLQTTVDENIYAFGDCAACPMHDGTASVPPRAQAAHQQAKLLARILANRSFGRDSGLVFRYRDFGSLINLSVHNTVGNLMGNLFGRQAGAIGIEGWFARLVYLSLYKLHQITVQGVIRTALMTLANILTRSAKPRLKLH